jgi:hypothetical protein
VKNLKQRTIEEFNMVAIFPGATTAGGSCMAMPDVCKTPVPPPVGQVPIPYPNDGMLNQATNASTKVKFVNKEVVTLKSKIPKSIGDEAGTLGGLISGKNMDEVGPKKGSSKVKIEKQPCIHLTSMTAHNGTNANSPLGTVMATGQSKVIIAP